MKGNTGAAANAFFSIVFEFCHDSLRLMITAEGFPVPQRKKERRVVLLYPFALGCYLFDDMELFIESSVEVLLFGVDL